MQVVERSIWLRKKLEPLARVPLFWDIFQFILGGNREKFRLLSLIFSQPGKILEIGCATGNIAPFFEKFDYTGVDTDIQSVESAQKKFASSSFQFFAGDINSLKIEKNSFDYVLISHTAHHLSDEDFAKIIATSHNFLKIGGRLIVLDMIRPGPEEIFTKQLGYRLDRGEFMRTLDEFRTFFNSSGFLNVTLERRACQKLGFISMIDSCIITANKA